MLSIEKKIIFDESISHYEIHSHQPYVQSTYNNNDEIRISVQNQDAYVLPSKSSLHICGKITKPNGAAVATTNMINNAVCHLFEEIRYEINAIEIERVKNVGLTTTMKAYISQSPRQNSLLENAGWFIEEGKSLTSGGHFDISIPLSFLLGFCEDYQRILANVKHELILTRTNNDVNAILQTAPAGNAAAEEYKITINKIEWLMPYIKVSDQQRIRMLSYISKDPTIAMSFRSWDLYEYPLIPQTNKHVWSVKTSTQLEKPRYIIVGFQTGRKNVATQNMGEFDHCNLREVKLYLNSQCYPYMNLNLNFARNQIALLYEMYANFQSSFFDKDNEPLLTKTLFTTKAPLIVIDCAKQNESLITGPVDVRLEFESDAIFPAPTSAYCLILHDRIVEYQPISGVVKKLV